MEKVVRLVKHSILLLLIFITLSLSNSFSYSNESRRDGNWWLQLTQEIRVFYVLGLFDGVNLGCNFAHWKWAGVPDKNISILDSLESCRDYRKTYLGNVTAGQLRDGLNEFYKDFKNRHIVIDGAAWLVLNQISGNPKVESMIEGWRRSANQN